ncbi:FHA domain-containing protein [Pseudoclavibacter soli]|uniref:FHA domain-containing protein n=1 Tax=Pseudoclavibacter soli TaxID=452623 RepID=UPI00040E66DA|nr:FHA domain-containing protein [Pseudoclavibacter soli]
MSSEEHPAEDGVPVVPPQTVVSGDDSTLTFTSTFAKQLLQTGAIHIGVSPEELEAIASLPSRSALLIVRQGPNVGSRFLLDSDVVTVGRHPNADIFLDDVTVSRRHTEFRRTANGYDVVDLGSLNGTYLDGVRIDHSTLHDGAEVQIGKYRLTYYPSRHDLAQGDIA